jgi:hypothetical protein
MQMPVAVGVIVAIIFISHFLSGFTMVSGW